MRDGTAHDAETKSRPRLAAATMSEQTIRNTECASAARNFLLRRPAVRDNAAMEAEMPKAEPLKRKRRRLELTRIRGLLGFLAVECFLLASYDLSWFDFDKHKERPFLIVVGCAAAVIVWSLTSSARTQAFSLIQMTAVRLFRRRTYQFSLRTLFVFTMICAVAASWLGRKMERKRKEQEAVNAIVKSGSRVQYFGGKSEPTGPNWLRKLLGNGFFSEVECIDFHNATDAQLEYLDAIPELKDLALTGNDITDVGLTHLKGLTQLRSLYLDRTKITDAGLAELHELPNLETLSLVETKVTDVGLERLKGLTSLKGLNVDGCHITDNGLKNIKGLIRLQWLCLSETKVTDRGLAYLKDLKQLGFLRIIMNTNANVTGAGVAGLKNALPGLEVNFGPTVRGGIGTASPAGPTSPAGGSQINNPTKAPTAITTPSNMTP